MSAPTGRGPGKRRGGPRGPVASLIFVVVLVVVLYLVGQSIIHHNAIQNCLDSGRRDCDSQLAGH